MSLARRAIVAIAAMCSVPAVAFAQPAPAAAPSPERARLTALVARRPTAAQLCQLGELDRTENDLAAAVTHLDAGVTLHTRARRRAYAAEARCRRNLAMVYEARNDLRHARAQADAATAISQGSDRANTRTYALTLAARERSGDRCAEGLDADGLRSAERDALGYLAAHDSVAVRACLTAVRSRQGATGGLCVSRTTNTPAFAPNGAGWTAINATSAWRMAADAHVVIASNARGLRYVDCSLDEGNDEPTPEATWLTVGSTPVLVVSADDTYRDDEGGGPTGATRWLRFFDASLNLIGIWASSASDPMRQPLVTVPFEDTDGQEPRVDGDAIRIGGHRLVLREGLLVNGD